MATDNKSPSQLRDRERFFRFTQKTPDGKLFKEHIRRFSKDPNEFEDGYWIDYETALSEAQNGVLAATNCQALRDDVERTRTHRSTLGLPGKAEFTHVGKIPAWYHWRRIQEVNEPDYWNSNKNLIYELLFRIPEFACVPRDRLMAEWDALKPSTLKAFNTAGDQLTRTERSASRNNPAPVTFEGLKPLVDAHGNLLGEASKSMAVPAELFLPKSVAPAPAAEEKGPCIVIP